MAKIVGEKVAEAMENMTKRKRGGKVPGAAAKMRPDRRARGGATSDADPYTSAGKMSAMPYEKKQIPSPAGKGTAMEKASD